VSILGLSKPNATEQNKSLDSLETQESPGTFKSFLNGFLGNSRLSSTTSGFLDRARPLGEPAGTCFHMADLRRMLGISPYLPEQ
jgi:hypothetical protein